MYSGSGRDHGVTLDDALAQVGRSLVEVCEEASEVVLFGSRSAGLEVATSDWDVLCLGTGQTRHTATLDLIWVNVEQVGGPEWLGSELAHHVAHYGKWLHGHPEWSQSTFVSSQAIDRKIKHINEQVLLLNHKWERLAAPFRRKHAKLVLLDVLRLRLLLTGRPVPPSRALDVSSLGVVALTQIANDVRLSNRTLQQMLVLAECGA